MLPNCVAVTLVWTYFVIYKSTTTPLSSTVVTTSPLKLKSTALKGTAFASPPALFAGFLIEVMKPPCTSGSMAQIVPKELLNVVCEVMFNYAYTSQQTIRRCLIRCCHCGKMTKLCLSCRGDRLKLAYSLFANAGVCERLEMMANRSITRVMLDAHRHSLLNTHKILGPYTINVSMA